MPELQFKGKEFVFNHHLTVPYRPLIRDSAKSLGQDEANGNLIIHGDNLHALKALMPRFAGLVDCIFIDPPYNTGNESWNYNDNVNSPLMREWLASNPVNKEDMLRHDKWLCMMYPRLKLLQELLRESGTLWMTLDHNEAPHARIICDEIFGENNFLAQIAWEKVYSPRMDAQGFSTDFDQILVYAKSKPDAYLNAQVAAQNEAQFTYVEPETGRKARLRTLRKEGSASLRADRENCWYRIVAPDGTDIFPIKPDGTEGRWRWEEATYLAEKDKQPSKVLVQKNDEGKWEVWVKQYYKGDADRPISTIFRNADFGHTHEAAEEIKRLFGSSVFPTPKPSRLVQGILELALPDDGLVLDSFAGSGTTAHAVLALNNSDHFERRFILVECEDYADTITAERVRRVINGYAFSGTQREELLTERLTLNHLKKWDAMLQKVAAIENLESHRFDRVKKELKDGVFTVTGEKDVTEKTDGLGGTFSYCTLGEPVDLDKLLVGEILPEYSALGAWLFHTATGQSLDQSRVDSASWFLGESTAYFVWLLYKPDLQFLKSRESALTVELAEKLSKEKKGKRHLVFAPARFAPNKLLLPLGVEYAPLPFALYRVEKQ